MFIRSSLLTTSLLNEIQKSMKNFKNSLKKLSLTRKSSKVRQSTEKDRLIDVNAKRIAYNESFPKILVYKDISLPGDIIHPKVLDDLPDFDVREDDIYIVSYPQSGSQVVEEIITLIVNKHNFKNPSRRQRLAQVAKLEVANPNGHVRWLRGLKSPRIIATNLPFELIPDKVKETLCRVIYLVRNPKDHSVSYYYHHRVKGILSSFDDFIELYMNGHLLYGDWFNHVLSYYQLSQTYPENVLFISYEEIKIETNSITKLIVDFLGYELTDEEISEMIESLPKRRPSFDNKITEDENNIKQSDFEGVIGDWINYFSPEQSRQMDELFRSRFSQSGLSMSFDPIDALKRLRQSGRIILNMNNENKSSLKPKRKISNSFVSEKSGLTKEEVQLLRNDSLKKIEMFTIESETKKKDKSCMSWVRRWFCSCFY